MRFASDPPSLPDFKPPRNTWHWLSRAAIRSQSPSHIFGSPLKAEVWPRRRCLPRSSGPRRVWRRPLAPPSGNPQRFCVREQRRREPRREGGGGVAAEEVSTLFTWFTCTKAQVPKVYLYACALGRMFFSGPGVYFYG